MPEKLLDVSIELRSSGNVGAELWSGYDGKRPVVELKMVVDASQSMSPVNRTTASLGARDMAVVAKSSWQVDVDGQKGQ